MQEDKLVFRVLGIIYNFEIRDNVSETVPLWMMWPASSHLNIKVWQYGLWIFQIGDIKLEILLPKNQHTQRKLFNFEFWTNGELSKSAKF